MNNGTPQLRSEEEAFMKEVAAMYQEWSRMRVEKLLDLLCEGIEKGFLVKLLADQKQADRLLVTLEAAKDALR
jgi:hypothetical protein